MKKVLLAFIFTLILVQIANAEGAQYGKYSCNYYYSGRDHTCTVYNDKVNGQSSDCKFLTSDVINRIIVGKNCKYVPVRIKTYKCTYGINFCTIATKDDNHYITHCANDNDNYTFRATDDFRNKKCIITY